MNIDDLTLGQLKEISKLVGIGGEQVSKTLNSMTGQKVIVRTYSAGCWFGYLDQKSGNEVILKNARRMFFWQANQGISLSACAIYGVTDKSKIVEAVNSVWLEAIEILPCTDIAIQTLEGAENVEAD